MTCEDELEREAEKIIEENYPEDIFGPAYNSWRSGFRCGYIAGANAQKEKDSQGVVGDLLHKGEGK